MVLNISTTEGGAITSDIVKIKDVSLFESEYIEVEDPIVADKHNRVIGRLYIVFVSGIEKEIDFSTPDIDSHLFRLVNSSGMVKLETKDFKKVEDAIISDGCMA